MGILIVIYKMPVVVFKHDNWIISVISRRCQLLSLWSSCDIEALSFYEAEAEFFKFI